jgi:hypothetical protein
MAEMTNKVIYPRQEAQQSDGAPHPDPVVRQATDEQLLIERAVVDAPDPVITGDQEFSDRLRAFYLVSIRRERGSL